MKNGYESSTLRFNFRKTLLSRFVIGVIVTGSLISANSAALAVDQIADNVERFDSTYFLAFEPQTLYDVLNNIPGAKSLVLALSRNSNNRGFGSGGDQILINGQRVAGKENGTREELDNIQATDVDYIELIRGSTAGFDIQSNGLVINVVLKDEVEDSLLWSVGAVKTSGTPVKPQGSILFSSGIGKAKYRVGFNNNIYLTKLTIEEAYASPQGELTDSFFRVRDNRYEETQFNGKFEYPFSDKTALNLNGIYERISVNADYVTEHQELLADDFGINKVVIDWGLYQWELGGDITHDLSEQSQLKLLFISNREKANDQLWRVSGLEVDEEILDYRLPRRYIGTENVLRGSWDYQASPKYSTDTGAEIAINTRDENLQFISEGGAYHSTELNDIKETRYEVFSHHTYALASDLNLQASLVYERSTMDVNTDFTLVDDGTNQIKDRSSRTFDYWKPRLNLQYDLTDSQQLRFNYERTVSQLDLNDFVPEFNRDEVRLEETNPNLKPQVQDEFSVSYEVQWADKTASLKTTPYYYDITDLITEVPLAIRAGEGNVDKAKEYGVMFEAYSELKEFGFENTLISTNLTLRDSEVVDPFTGNDSSMVWKSSSRWDLTVNQNEILPNTSLNFTLIKRTPNRFSRFDYLGKFENELTGEGFIDYQINKNFKLRFNTQFIFKRKYKEFRQRYSGLFTNSGFLRYEQRKVHRKPRYTLTLSGQF
ncbi:hypothetical protein SOPP22_11150 [Shewanella sp. OPT22]|nr:hypothetical protein SOPP22_11150 [Shewanella sp. OPT22]